MAPGSVAAFKAHLAEATRLGQKAEWESVGQQLAIARSICERRGYPDAARAKLKVKMRQAEVERRQGTYERAQELLMECRESEVATRAQKVEIEGAIAVVQKALNNLDGARNILRMQLEQAYVLGLDAELDGLVAESQRCRAIGNLGWVNFNFYQIRLAKTGNRDTSLLLEAMDQTQQRVDKARQLSNQLRMFQDKLSPDDVHHVSVSELQNQVATWECIGLARFALLYAADSDFDRALAHGLESIEKSKELQNSTTRAMSRFFYGSALLRAGKREEALRTFNLNDPCTSAIALCREPSDEHCGYLEELVNEGVDLEQYDEHGYNTLDYAVFAGNRKMQDIVIRGLYNQKLSSEVIERLKADALLRKSCREIFNHHFRPVLVKSRADSISSLQLQYAKILDEDEIKRGIFDKFNLIRYDDFRRRGELPLMSDDMVHNFSSGSNLGNVHLNPFVVFFSYRWLRKAYPDDERNTQYERMLDSIEDLLEKKTHISSEQLYIWLDCACIDQKNTVPGRKERGINALPILISQCNAMISLIDDSYFDRAWCAVEVLMMQTLCRSYGVHELYEHILHDPKQDSKRGSIERIGEMIIPSPSNLQVSEPRDLLHIAFLERQSLLLGSKGPS